MYNFNLNPPEKKERHLNCPVCGEEDPETFYFNGMECVGCSECVDAKDWQDVEEVDLLG